MIEFESFFRDVKSLGRIKVKFNMNAGDISKPALELLLEDSNSWIEMNAWKTKHANNNLNNCDYLISLAQYYPYGPEYFLFGGIYKVRKNEPEVFDTQGYELSKIEQYNMYVKRLIIKIDKPIGRDLYNRKFENVQIQLNPEIYMILPPYSEIKRFNGYQNVSLKYKEMEQIFICNEPSWKEVLSNVKGIYVITDTSDGSLYIGSASSNNDGIWQRWEGYADSNNLTNGNIGLNELVKLKGAKHIKDNFTYSIIEIFDTKTKVEVILERENYWKKVFDSRRNGFNRN